MKKNEIIGVIIAFVLGLLFNAFGTIVIVIAEFLRSKREHVEIDNVVRYSVFSSVGALLHYMIVLSFLC